MSTLIFDLGCFVATVAMSVAGVVVARRRRRFMQVLAQSSSAEGMLTPRETDILIQVFEQPFDDEGEDEDATGEESA